MGKIKAAIGDDGGSKLKKKKGFCIDDNEYSVISMEDQQNDDQEEAFAGPVVITGKKKKKGKSKKGGGTVFSNSSFGLLEDENDNDDDAIGVQGEEDEDDDDDGPAVSFKSNKSFSAFAALNDDDGQGEVIDEDEESVIQFTGKKRSSKSTKKVGAGAGVVVSSAFAQLAEDAKEDELSIVFSGKKKKKSSKGSKNSDALPSADGEIAEDVSKPVADKEEVSVTEKEEVAVKTSKNKKKKKSARIAADQGGEDDLDKALAELGELPSVKTPVQPETVAAVDITTEAAVPVDATEEGEPGESAAAKKKRKKKEKEKEKKAAAAATASGPAPTEGGKKVPKHVREMQEALAKAKEAEERRKREEEEKLRKEEEERLRQEEIEREQEEIKRKKKEREKEKLLKKKLEGKLLTKKQKEEAKRLEAMRNQIAAKLEIKKNQTTATTSKRPKYENKKAQPLPNPGDAPAKAVESIEPNGVLEETESSTISSGSQKVADVEVTKVDAEAVVEENEDEESDTEWDKKSWDDPDIKLPTVSAFDEEDNESEPEAVVASRDEQVFSTATNPTIPQKKISSEAPTKSIDFEGEKVKTVVEIRGSRGKKKEAAVKKNANKPDIVPKTPEENLRSPICCIMGHVDTGKTKLLDCIRGTNVQEGEAGGITQQIGATYFPAENIRDRTKELKADAKLNVPGLLVIDTPGHESFTNLRSRGSGLCDIAILVVDIMHGLEPQTIESLNLLTKPPRNTEFIVALNKVDRLYGWRSCTNKPIRHSMREQSKDVIMEFNSRLTHVITQFKEQGLNTELYYKNSAMKEVISIVPTSAISGEGILDLLLLLVQWAQKTMIEKLTYSDKVQCTVLEVKVIEGLGTTIDVVLVNGVLREGDQIVVCGTQGPIVTSIRALLTPHPMRELRVKGTYLHHKEIKAAQGIKISAQGLEHAIAGTGLHIVDPEDDLEEVKAAAMEDMHSVFSRIDRSAEGVSVQASTIGSLEALLEYLKTPAVQIPASGISIGPVHKKDVMKASVMLEKKKDYAVILAFDVKVTPEARDLAEELGVKIFTADIIYHLCDQFKAYIDNLKEEKKKEAAAEAVFPCVLKIIPNCIFNKKDPIVLGVDVLDGIVKVGTPICIPSKEFIDIGRIASIENNHQTVDSGKKGQKLAIKIVGSNAEEQQKMFGRHFEIEDELVSRITRESIDVLRANYLDDLHKDDKILVHRLKRIFRIP